MKHFTLIDASGFIFRAYHSLPPLTNPQGVPVGAVVGFINMMLKLAGESKADAIGVVFDHGRINFRHTMYEAYKANRPPAPEDLVPQFPLVREATTAMGFKVIDIEGVEADDVIASYAVAAKAAGMSVSIVSSDKDLMQLIGGGVKMYDAMKQKVIAEPEVLEKFGVAPNRVLDVLSLMGDSSDNVPGVPGIGPKTAAELINTYGDLDGLLARAGEIKQEKRRQSIIENADKARLSRNLIRLKDNVPLPFSFEDLTAKPIDKTTLIPFLQLHGFKNVLARLGESKVQAPEFKAHEATVTPAKLVKDYTLIRTESELLALIKQAQAAGYVVVDVETTGLNIITSELVGIAFGLPDVAYYLPLAHVVGGGGADLFDSGKKPVEGQLKTELAIALLKPLLEDASVLKIGHNIKYDAGILANAGIHITPVDDTMLMSYCLFAGLHGHGMDELSERYLGHKPISYDGVTGTGKARKSFAEVELDAALNYAAEDAQVTLKLWQLFKPMLAAEKLQTLYQTIERPLIPVIAAMERAGIMIDSAKLHALSNQFAVEIAALEKEIIQLAGMDFNVASPKQLGEVLFEHLKLEGGKKSAKTGAYGTDADVLEALAEAGHAIASKVLEHRSLSKLKSTYTDSLPKQVTQQTGRVHTSFSMAIASTGRLSSSDPNLQNIPIRNAMGKKIRECFIAPDGKKLISADYSQIELRLLAHVADIGALKAAFAEGRDIHAQTAADVFGVSEVSAELRRNAKAVNFGIIYGISAHGLALNLGISRGEAAEIIERYFKQYPGIRDYMEATKETARAKGYVETLFGRRCHVPGIHDKNAARRQFYERAAINAPLQGSAADIIKRAMVTLSRGIRDLGLGNRVGESRITNHESLRMLLQVHDELIFECDDAAVEAALPIIKRTMEQAATLSVPLLVEAKAGKHWGEAH